MFGLSLVSLFTTLIIVACITSALIVITFIFAAGPSSDAMDAAFREHLLEKHKMNTLRTEVLVDLSHESHHSPNLPVVGTEQSLIQHRGIDTIAQKNGSIQENENVVVGNDERPTIDPKDLIYR